MISENFKVSIVMNCYNGEKYLDDSLKSIFSQTYENWELIFWDNLSKDKSREILTSFDDKRIKYFRSSKFLNLYDARNQAIEKSDGKYICFLDTDDFWEKNKLEKQLEFLRVNNKYKIVYSNYYTLNENKNKTYINNKKLPNGVITKSLLKNYVLGILTVCADRYIFEKNKFDDRYNIIGDFDFFIKISEKFDIGCIQEPLAHYRVHNNNYSRKKLKTYIWELKQWIIENKSNLSKNGHNLNRQRIELIKLRIKSLLSILGV